MTTRRNFFGWLAGAAAAPAVARDALAGQVTEPGIAIQGFVPEFVGVDWGEEYRVKRSYTAEAAAELARLWKEQEAYIDSFPRPVCAPRHYIRARLHRLPGLPEYVARQKRPRRRSA